MLTDRNTFVFFSSEKQNIFVRIFEDSFIVKISSLKFEKSRFPPIPVKNVIFLNLSNFLAKRVRSLSLKHETKTCKVGFPSERFIKFKICSSANEKPKVIRTEPGFSSS